MIGIEALIEFHGGVFPALTAATDADIIDALNGRVVSDIADLGQVVVGGRLHDLMGQRFLKTDMGAIVNIDNGETMNVFQLSYPLEVVK